MWEVRRTITLGKREDIELLGRCQDIAKARFNIPEAPPATRVVVAALDLFERTYGNECRTGINNATS